MAEQQGQSQNSSGADNGGEGNIDQIMADYQARLDQTSGALEQSNRELSGLKSKVDSADATFSKLRQALGGKDENAAPEDPFEVELQQYQQEMDAFLQAAVDAERAGRPIPLTARTAINSLQGLISKTKQLQSTERRLAEVEGRVQRVSNPSYQIDQQAFATMDSQVMAALNTIYGDDEATKAAQFRSVTNLIGQEIKALTKDDPQMWDRIRRNPADQKKLVNHFIEKTIPPAARRLLEEDQIRKTPLTVNDLWAAWQESKEIENPAQRKEIQEMLRPQLLERIYAKNRGDRGGKGINGLFG